MYIYLFFETGDKEKRGRRVGEDYPMSSPS
jgi:hypothetical protein